MDSSNSRKSDAAATRKRRSSILKSQRAPRAPLSELEFNVATPQEQAKSRRVSFSRRTGVAEFEINEATTAWKNVYEEHNKSLETSANESGARGGGVGGGVAGGGGAGAGGRRRVQHLGGRAQLFQDEEADELVDDPPAAHDLSACTEHRTVQLFRVEGEPDMRDLTDRLELDFSAVAPLAPPDLRDPRDDLDLLQRDLERSRRGDLSEINIDVDFNATHVSLKAEESGTDMSITDTIRSPRVTGAAKCAADWSADKENIAVNPYVAPPSADFADDGCDDILVFDGKKCKFQSNLDLSDDEAAPKRAPDTLGECDISVTQAILGPNIKSEDSPDEYKTMFFENIADITVTQAVPAQVLVARAPERRRTVVYDGDDGHVSMTEAVPAHMLPTREAERTETIVYGNDDGHISMTEIVPVQILQPKESERRKTIVYGNDDGHISMTEAVPARILSKKEPERRRTIVYENDDGHISMTEAIPAQILQQKESERRKTIVYENDEGHISMTEAVPAQILSKKEPERRRTIVYENDDGHISMTEAIPAQILQRKESERRKTIEYENDEGNLSVTQAVPAQILSEKEPERRKTIVYGNDEGHISMTETVPAQILSKKEPERRRTIVYENDDGHISMTEAIPAQILQRKESERRKTIEYENDEGNLSVTQAVPAQILSEKEPERRKTIVYGNDDGHISMTETVPAQILSKKEPERRRTIVYENDDGHISMTEAVPAQILQRKESECRKTIVYGNDDGHVSLTEAVPAQILSKKESERRRTIMYENDDGHISMTETVLAQILQQKEPERRKTIVYGNDDGHISMTEAVPAQTLQQKEAERRKTIVYEKDEGNLSVTEAVPAQILQQKESERRNITYDISKGHLSMTETFPAQILLQKDSERRKTIMYGNEDGHVSMTEAVPANIYPQDPDRRRTMMYDGDDGHISMTEAIHAQILPQQNSERRQTVVYDNDTADVSVTRAVPGNIINAPKIHSKEEFIICHGAAGKLVESEMSESVLEKQQIVHFDNTMDMSLTRAVIEEEPQRPQASSQKGGDSHLLVTVNNINHMARDKGHNVVQPEQADQREPFVHESDLSITKEVQANLLTNDEGKLAERTNTKQRKTMDNSSNVSITAGNEKGTICKEEENKEELTQSNDRYMKTIDDISMNGDDPTYNMDKGNETEADMIKQNESCKSTVEYGHNEDLSMTGVASKNIMTSQIQSNECDKENITITLQKEPSQITVYEDEDLKVSRSVVHSAPAIEPDEEASLNAFGGKPSSTLNKSLGDRVMVYGASHASVRAGNKDSFYEDRSPPTSDRARPSLDALTLRSVLESASMLNALAVSPRLASALPPPPAQPAADRTSVLDLLLDMSADAAPTPAHSPRRTDSDATITAAASQEKYIMIVDDEPEERPPPEPPHPLPLEYKRDGDGIIRKIQRRLSKLKDKIHYKDKSPKKEAEDTSNQTQTGTGTDCLTAASRASADDTRALLDALTDLTASRRSGDFAGRAASPALEHKPSEARPTRKSMVRSREDLLKDISMAQALMKAEEEQVEEEEPERELEPEAEPVVRTLRFEDDDDDDTTLLRKPFASPEATPRPERAAVIPPYLHNVSDHVKELVEDLMKPMADVTPLRPSRPPERTRCSSGVQAELLPSSQIDLLPSRPVPLRPRSPVSCMKRRSVSVAAAHHEHLSDDSSTPDSKDTNGRERVVTPRSPRRPTADAVIVFDHDNPLNNVLLPPADPGAAHKYDPRRSAESVRPLDTHGTQTEARTHLECGLVLVRRDREPAVEARRDREVLTDEVRVDRSSAGLDAEMRDTEVNTAIVMKPNRDLLAASSSLTLVDDALTRAAFDPTESRAVSPMRVIFRPKDSCSSVKLESELTSSGDVTDDGKGQKRGRSPKRCTFAEDATPKPAAKVKKMSNSSEAMRKFKKSLSPGSRSQGAPEEEGGAPGRGRTVTVQRVSELSVRTLPDSAGPPSVRSESGSGSGSRDWQPELLHELSSKDLVSEFDPHVNVVPKIDVLPFMGTSDCEWESRASDTWSFLVLRGRLRLVVRLAHRSDNAARALVRADTPVRLVVVQHARDHAEGEGGAPVWSLCLCLAASALQRAAGGVRRAGGVPALLRRAAGVARVATCWARALHYAHKRLAFTLTEDGLLSLKVANIPMRSVWEVTLRVQLHGGGDGGSCPWPEAREVRVARVVAAWAPAACRLRALLDPVPPDWGHVPRVLWKIFKYLKNRKPEDELLCV